ncbi:SDR family NAD(P)-dependent oxidoreductase [Amycolatopsis benzoatilytica]|uniref:SDR family NAD(P)-dependent oxidoreductase n=1 Tax=Amycolatopsis benzoatilytica TaxID=346045 RepID=UPI00039B2DFA|nr:SDR family NAD(P)-dependent oxidoreductase [Amycolatopsis benzoatilytica]
MTAHEITPVLRRRVALVTGAASGIGGAIARQLCADGLAVALVDRDAEGLAAVAESCAGPVLPATCDVVDAAAVRETVDAVAQWGGRLDVVVNGAGILVRADAESTTPEVWHRVLDVNLTGTFQVIQAALPHLRAGARTAGRRIVNIASGAATRGYVYPAYSASKGGVTALTRQLASEVAPLGITVNAVNPGVVRTAINRDSWEDDAVRERWERLIPLGRLGEPEDIAALVGFLASEAAGFITAQDIGVDGGSSNITAKPW